jgi:hypothetical protein
MLQTLLDQIAKPITGVLYINVDKNVIADRLKGSCPLTSGARPRKQTEPGH